jgi:hypothetical protein
MTNTTALKWLNLSQEELNNYPDLLVQIYQEKVHGTLIKQVFSPAEMNQVAQKIKANEVDLHPTVFGATIGLSLSQKITSDRDYFQEADKFRKIVKQLFVTNFEKKIESIISQISGGAEIEIPQENSRYYTPATIRLVNPQTGGIPPHTGSEFLYNAGYDFFKNQADLADSMSYFLVIDKPESGGELVIYDLFLSATDKTQEDLLAFFLDVKTKIDVCSQISLKPDVGDMIIFKGSTIMHKVANVEGTQKRLTIGGFLAFSHEERSSGEGEHKKIYYWS